MKKKIAVVGIGYVGINLACAFSKKFEVIGYDIDCNKIDKMYKVKYIYTRNKQLQPMTFDRYHYLVDVGKDENGSYIEYAMVYDKLYDPLIRFVYIIAVFAVLAYLLYAYKLGAMSIFSAGVLGVIVVASVVLVLKKSKETKEECLKAEKLFKNLISDIDFS